MVSNSQWNDLITILDELELLPLSYSKLNTLKSCPRLFNERYNKKSEQGVALQGEAATVGKFIHSVAEFCVNRGNTFGMEWDCLDFKATWVSLGKQMGLTTKEYDMAAEQRLSVEVILQKVLEIITKNNLSVTTEMSLILGKNMESRANIKWPQRFVFGYLDLFGITQSRRTAIILDYKSFSQENEAVGSVEEQTDLYTAIAFLRYPELQKVINLAAYIPDEEIVTLSTTTRADLPELLSRIYERVLAGATIMQECKTTEAYLPIKSKMCDYCNYRSTCPAFAKKRKSKK